MIVLVVRGVSVPCNLAKQCKRADCSIDLISIIIDHSYRLFLFIASYSLLSYFSFFIITSSVVASFFSKIQQIAQKLQF